MTVARYLVFAVRFGVKCDLLFILFSFKLIAIGLVILMFVGLLVDFVFSGVCLIGCLLGCLYVVCMGVCYLCVLILLQCI